MSKTEAHWHNPAYGCGMHTYDTKWPTEEGGMCFKLSTVDGKCNHYFDSWQHAYSLGWRKALPDAEINYRKNKS